VTDAIPEQTGLIERALLLVVHVLRIVSGVEMLAVVNVTGVRKAIVLQPINNVKVAQHIAGNAPVGQQHAITATEDTIR
jgi:hypothetical protein